MLRAPGTPRLKLIGITVPPAVAERLREIAEAEDRTVAAVGRRVLTDWYAEQGQRRTDEGARRG